MVSSVGHHQRCRGTTRAGRREAHEWWVNRQHWWVRRQLQLQVHHAAVVAEQLLRLPSVPPTLQGNRTPTFGLASHQRWAPPGEPAWRDCVRAGCVRVASLHYRHAWATPTPVAAVVLLLWCGLIWYVLLVWYGIGIALRAGHRQRDRPSSGVGTGSGQSAEEHGIVGASRQAMVPPMFEETLRSSRIGFN